MTRCLIYHIIGTLTPEHIRLSLWSLANQEPHEKWDKLLIYNTDPTLPTNEIFSAVALNPMIDDQFKTVEARIFDSPEKSVIADWDRQMKEVDGYDYYLCFKADFVLPRHILATLDRQANPATEPWFINFYKVDGKEYVTDKEYKKATQSRNVMAFTQENSCGVYGLDSMIKAKFILPQVPVGKLWDGVMHAYSDAAREMFRVQPEDINEWGYAFPIQRMADYGCELIQNDQLFAIHKWHEVPQKTDRLKLITGERF